MLPGYRPVESFDRDDCEDCSHNIGEDVVVCSNQDAVKFIQENRKCKEYKKRIRTQGDINMEEI